MTPAPRTLRLVDAAAVIMLIAAAILAAWPAHVSVNARGDSAKALRDVAVVAPSVGDSSSDASTVVAANILSATRRAPASHYVSPDLQAAMPYTPPAAFAQSVANDSAHAEAAINADSAPAVYGIVSVNGAWRALLRLNASDMNPVLLQEGDKRGSYRVISISAERVVVAGPAGQRTLKLSRTARADSTGHKP